MNMQNIKFLPFSILTCSIRGVQPTHQLAKIDPTQPNSTRRVGSVFRGWWVGLAYANFFNSGLGWVWVITITNLPNSTWPTYIFKIYIIYIIINNFFI